MEFAKDFIQVNDACRLSVAHESVSVYSNLLIWSIDVSPTCNRLESQVIPLLKYRIGSEFETNHVFANRRVLHAFTNPASLLQDGFGSSILCSMTLARTNGFRLSGRKATANENRRWRGSLVMEARISLGKDLV